jgi:hypothetical protein
LLGVACRLLVAMGALEDVVSHGHGLGTRLGQAGAAEGDLLVVQVGLADFEVRR